MVAITTVVIALSSQSIIDIKDPCSPKRYCVLLGAHQMEIQFPTQALGVNPFPGRFMNRTVP